MRSFMLIFTSVILKSFFVFNHLFISLNYNHLEDPGNLPRNVLIVSTVRDIQLTLYKILIPRKWRARARECNLYPVFSQQLEGIR